MGQLPATLITCEFDMMNKCKDCGLLESKDIGWKIRSCLWFGNEISEDEISKERSCPEFMKKILGLNPRDHLEIKKKRDTVELARRTNRQVKIANLVSFFALMISIISALIALGYFG